MDGTKVEKKLKLEEKLRELDELAQKVIDMPTFTSNDRAFLKEVPAFPEENGKKVLTATTSNGKTILSYEETQSGGVVYASSESEVGTWNGKTLYRRLFTVGVSNGVEWNSTLDNDTPVDFACLEFGYIDNQASERRYYSCNTYIDGSSHSYAYAGVQNERIHLYHRVDGGLFTNKQLTVSILYTKKTT